MATDQEIQDLQSVSQHVLSAADKIKRLELEKRSVPPGSPQFIDLSAEIERLAADLGVVSASETDIALEVAGEPNLPTIEQADQNSGAMSDEDAPEVPR